MKLFEAIKKSWYYSAERRFWLVNLEEHNEEAGTWFLGTEDSYTLGTVGNVVEYDQHPHGDYMDEYDLSDTDTGVRGAP